MAAETRNGGQRPRRPGTARNHGAVTALFGNRLLHRRLTSDHATIGKRTDMRRICKTTTAIVTCMSLVAPHLAVAQDQQQAAGSDAQLVPPKDKPARAKDQDGQAQPPRSQPGSSEGGGEGQAAKDPGGKAAGQASQGKAPEAAPSDRAQAGAGDDIGQSRRPAAAAQQQAQDRQPPKERQKPEPQAGNGAQGDGAQGDGARGGKAAAGQGDSPPPSAKPKVTQAGEPRSKPPLVQADEPQARPRKVQPDQPAPGERSAPESDDAAAADRAPRQRPQADSPEPAVRQQSPRSTEAPQTDAAAQEPPAAPSGRPQGERPGRQGGDAADGARQQTDAPRNRDGRTAGARPAEPPDAQELERRLQERQQAPESAAETAPDRRPEQRAGDEARPETETRDPRRRAQDGTEEQSRQTDRAETQAPEIRARPNAVAQRAAEMAAPAPAAALSAGDEDGESRARLDEVRITRENSRSSAEEFATSVARDRPRDRRLRAEPQSQESRRDEDDDTVTDIAKLLLAGAAGMAVGKMLSNDRQVALNTGDRVVVSLPDGSQQVIKDDNALLYQPGSNVRTESFDDGSTRTTVLRADGSRVVTIRDADMNILRRSRIDADGRETRLIDDTRVQPVQISALPAPPPVSLNQARMDEAALREALRREAALDRRFSLGQIRNIPEVRALVAPVNLPEITFDSGSAAITPDQAQQLASLGKVIRDSIGENPNEIYMIEGYTDAVGPDAANLALSDRRAESVALALTEYFQVPPENMVVQGYGEQFLLVPTEGAERQNRRVALRRITDLLAQD